LVAGVEELVHTVVVILVRRADLAVVVDMVTQVAVVVALVQLDREIMEDLAALAHHMVQGVGEVPVAVVDLVTVAVVVPD
jgi:hypothetical protein